MVAILHHTRRFAAIGATLLKGFDAKGRPNSKGGYLVTLDRHVVDRLAALRGRGESYSDVILRLAKDQGPC